MKGGQLGLDRWGWVHIGGKCTGTFESHLHGCMTRGSHRVPGVGSDDTSAPLTCNWKGTYPYPSSIQRIIMTPGYVHNTPTP
eukprot:763130-Hanusia_phi.AAC.5